MDFFKFFTILFPLLFFIFLGTLSQNVALLREEGSRVLDKVIIYLTLPALIFEAIYRSPLSLSFLKIPLLAWLVMLACLGAAFLLRPMLSFKKETLGAFLLACAIGNTGYLGYPLTIAFYRESGFARALFYDLLGTVPFIFTIGVTIAEIYGKPRRPAKGGFIRGKGDKKGNPLKEVFTFPPLLALIAAYLFQRFSLPSFVLETIGTLGAATIPLILISIGLSLKFEGVRAYLLPLLLILLVKLVFSPVLAYLAGGLFLKGKTFGITVLEASMPTFMLSMIIGLRYRLDTSFIAAAILFSTLVSLVTIPLWQFLFHFI